MSRLHTYVRHLIGDAAHFDFKARAPTAVQRRAGQTAEAVTSFSRALELFEQLPLLSPRDQFCIARVHSQMAGIAGEAGSGLKPVQGGAEADLAMKSLRLACDVGFCGIGRLRTDVAFDPLRARPDFQVLMKELEAKIPEAPGEAKAERTK